MTSANLPRHIAIVMDGNGRWAKQRHMPRKMGHRAGAKAVRKLIETCAQKGIKVLTLFAFSSENWNRPQDEVQTLMGLFLSNLEIGRAHV
jgi:undecaprenyl diphosphate synthase